MGHNVTIEDPGETIALSLPPGVADAPADELLATLYGADALAAAIPVISVDTTAKGTVTLVGVIPASLSFLCITHLHSASSAADQHAHLYGAACRDQPIYTAFQGLPMLIISSN